MLFNSVEFAIFFIVVYALYLLLNNKWQNIMLLVASYIFYSFWDWRFLSLILISTIIDYFCGLEIYKTKKKLKRKIILLISVFANLGILGFFKYFNFFAESFQFLFSNLGFNIQPIFLNIVLPVGISFYTFQTMSYTMDIYYRKIKPTNKFLDFALFVAFFPQLVAGPIERAKNLLPQISNERKITLDCIYKGSYLILWGLFQKIFVADNLAYIVDTVFTIKPNYNGINVLIGMYAFCFQIFCDFAGYSNIARGISKLMGIDIMVNFNLPYFATNPSDFWRRWHISLSSWLRDYLYIPLGGNRYGNIITFRNLVIVMVLGGLWHGAAWTFVFWGLYHAILLIVYKAIKPVLIKIGEPKNLIIQKIWFGLRVVFFFHLVAFGFLMFRAQSCLQFWEMFKSIFINFGSSESLETINIFNNFIFYVTALIVIQFWQFLKKDLMAIYNSKIIFSSATAAMFVYLMIRYHSLSREFIYFKF